MHRGSNCDNSVETVSREKHMPTNGLNIRASNIACHRRPTLRGGQREWVYDVAGAIAGKETILYHGQARSAAKAEASARKWIGGQSAGSKSSGA